MEPCPVSPGKRRGAASLVAAGTVLMVLAGTATAWAQIGEDLLPPLDPTTEPTAILPTPFPSPSELLPSEDPIGGTDGLIEDTIETITGAGDDEQQVDPPNDPTGSGGNGSGGSTGGGSQRGGGDNATSPEGAADGGAAEGAADGDPASEDPTAASVVPYGTVAADAALAIAGRAIRLAGPLAPPLILAATALIALLALGRGSDGLLKIDAIRSGRRTYRL